MAITPAVLTDSISDPEPVYEVTNQIIYQYITRSTRYELPDSINQLPPVGVLAL